MNYAGNHSYFDKEDVSPSTIVFDMTKPPNTGKAELLKKWALTVLLLNYGWKFIHVNHFEEINLCNYLETLGFLVKITTISQGFRKLSISSA